MGRAYSTYEISATTPHAQATSTSASNVQTLTPPTGANACILSVETNPARITFDGTDPSTSNGLIYQSGISPILVLLGRTIKFTSTVAGNSIVDVLWLV